MKVILTSDLNYVRVTDKEAAFLEEYSSILSPLVYRFKSHKVDLLDLIEGLAHKKKVKDERKAS